MKKSTIWILGIVMGLSFLSLLYLQVSYIEEMMKTRKEQFDSAVRNSLSQVSKDVEYAETQRWLVEDITEAERKALTENNSSLRQDDVVQSTQRFKVKSRDGKIISDFEMRVMTIKPSELPKVMVRGRNTIPQTSNSMLEAIKNRYMYQRALLDEVVLDMIRRASDKSIGERVRFGDLNGYLQANLYNNGIALGFLVLIGGLLGVDVVVHGGGIQDAVLDLQLRHLILLNEVDELAVRDLMAAGPLGEIVAVSVDIVEHHRQHQRPDDEGHHPPHIAVAVLVIFLVFLVVGIHVGLLPCSPAGRGAEVL